MAYTPELSQEHSQTLRRIAWALGVPMTKAMGKVFEQVEMTVDKNRICVACRDKSKCRIVCIQKRTMKGDDMEEYLYGISDKHKRQLEAYAKKHGVSIRTAIRNIVFYLKGDNFKAGMPDYMAEMVTGARIEGVIDMLRK